MWPKDWPEFQEDFCRFFEECFQIHLELLQALTEMVGVDRQTLLPSVAAKDSYTALLYYPETTAESFQSKVRSAPHTDFGTLTLLFNDGVGGLQVRDKQGQWVDAPPKPGHAIVNGKTPLPHILCQKLIHFSPQSLTSSLAGSTTSSNRRNIAWLSLQLSRARQQTAKYPM